MFRNLLRQVQGVDVKGPIKTLLDVLEIILGCKPCWALPRKGNTTTGETIWSTPQTVKLQLAIWYSV